MTMADGVHRRGFLKTMSGAGVMSAFPEAVFGLHAADTSPSFTKWLQDKMQRRSHSIQFVSQCVE